MRKTIAVARRILQQFKRDKRTLALVFVAPLIMLGLLSILINSDSQNVKIAVIGAPDEVAEELMNHNVDVMQSTQSEAEELLSNNQVAAVLTFNEDNSTDLTLEGSSGAANTKAQQAISQSLTKLNSDKLHKLTSELPTQTQNPMQFKDMTIAYFHGSEDWKSFDYYGPIFLGIFIFVYTFLTSSMSLVNERVSGTLQRLLASPVKSSEIVGGYALGFGFIGLLQSLVILTVGIFVIHFPNEGNFLHIVPIAITIAIASVTLGLLVSGLAHSAFQVIQLMLLFVVPQILFCGLFDISALPEILQKFSHCLPLTYSVEALKQVMLRGQEISEISYEMAVLWCFIAMFIGLATIRFRKKRV